MTKIQKTLNEMKASQEKDTREIVFNNRTHKIYKNKSGVYSIFGSNDIFLNSAKSLSYLMGYIK